MAEENIKSIVQMARGAIEERIDLEMTKILENILDPNTKATAKRKLTVTFDFFAGCRKTDTFRCCYCKEYTCTD